MHWITFSDARANNQLFYLYLERDAMRMGGYKMLWKYATCYSLSIRIIGCFLANDM